MRNTHPGILGRSLSNIELKTAQACAVDRSPARGSHASHSASAVPFWSCSIGLLYALRLRESDTLQSDFVYARSQICCVRVNAASFWWVSRIALYLQWPGCAESGICLSPPPSFPPSLRCRQIEITQMSPSQANETLNVASTRHRRPHPSVQEKVMHIAARVLCVRLRSKIIFSTAPSPSDEYGFSDAFVQNKSGISINQSIREHLLPR